MQPCSQPWYGLIDCVNGMSGESLRLMIVRAFWIEIVVLGGGAFSPAVSSSTRDQPSSTASRASRRKRLAGLKVAPRPFCACGGAVDIATRSGKFRVHRNIGVEHARYRAVGFGIGRDLGEFRRIDLGHPRSGRQVNRGNGPGA